MPWGVVAAGVAAAGSAYQGKKSREAAAASAEGAQNAAGLTQQQYEQTRYDLTPYRDIGEQALQALGRVSGLSGSAPDMSGFYESPDYQFRLQQGNRALERAGAARGMTLSGAQLKGLMEYNQGAASTEFGNWYNRMAGLAGMGQNAAVQTGTFGANAAANQGAALQNAANAQASGIMDQSNAYAQGLASLAGGMGQYAGRRSGYTQGSLPNNSMNSPLGQIWRGAMLSNQGVK